MATIAEIRRQYPQYKDLSDTQLADALHAKFYRDIPKDDFYRRVGITGTDFIDDLQRGGGQAIQAIGSALRDVPIDMVSNFGRRAEEYGREVVAANPADISRIQDVNSISSGLNYAGERIAEIIPQIAVPIGVGVGATMAGASAPVVGAATLGAGAIGSLTQEYGNIRQAQRESGIDDKARAALFAAPAAALDVAGVGRILPGAGRILGNVIQTGLGGIAKTAGRVGAEEAITEAAQTALERAGARQDLTSQEAVDEYINAAAAGLVGGAGIGGGRAVVDTVRGGQPTPATEPPAQEPPVTPPETTPVESGTAVSPAPAGIPAAPVSVSGPAPTPSGQNRVVEIDGSPVEVAGLTIDGDGNAVIEDLDGGVRVVPVDSVRVPEPAVVPTPEPVVATPEPSGVAALTLTPAAPGEVFDPTRDYIGEPAVATPEPAVISAPEPTPITTADFTAANTPSREFAAAVRGKTLPQVAGYLSENASLQNVRNIMGRAQGVLNALERSGVKFDFAVSDDRSGSMAQSTITSMPPTVRGVTSMRRTRDGGGSIAVGLKSMRASYPGVQEITASHEIIHAVTLGAIRERASLPENSRVRKAADGLAELRNVVGKHYAKIPKDQKPAINTNAFKDADELIAYGLTDKPFQDYLKSIPTPTGNAFTDFIAYIGRVLGLNKGEQNALARLIELTEDLIPVEAAGIADVVSANQTMFRMGDQPGAVQEINLFQEQDGLTLPPETVMQRARRTLQNRLARLEQAETLGQLQDRDKSAYEAARRMDSVAAARIEDFNRKYFKPIIEATQAAKISLNELDWFLYARAAEARNVRLEQDAIRRVVARVEEETGEQYDPTNPSQAFIDAVNAAREAGEITDSGSGIPTIEAQEMMRDYMERDEWPVYERIGDLFDKMHRERMELAVRNGLVSRETADYLMAAEPNYAPMKGHASQAGENQDLSIPDEEFDPVMGYGGSGIAVSLNEWRKAKGRSSLPFSPFGYAKSDAITSLVRGERNAVGQKFMDFIAANPSNMWRIYSERGLPRNQNGRTISVTNQTPGWLIVKRGGRPFYINVQDPLIERAVKALDVQQMRPLLDMAVIKFPAAIAKAMARSFTSWNPNFFIVNYARDLESAMLNIMSEEDAARGRAAGRDVVSRFARYATQPANARAIAAYEFETGRLNADRALVELYRQFKLDGGSVGWVSREDPKEVAEKVKQDFEDLMMSHRQFGGMQNREGRSKALQYYYRQTARKGRTILGALENTNAVFENGIRFAAYRAGLDAGLSRTQAAMLAREATVDFNMRGEAGALLNSLYMFANAGIQGTARTAKALSNNPIRTKRLTRAQMTVLGAMGVIAAITAYNVAVSAEDDDGELFYDKIDDYKKERAIIIMNPTDGQTYAEIPIPYGFGFFLSGAQKVSDAMRRGEMDKLAPKLVSSLLQNFSPLQFGQGATVTTSVAKALTPTLLKPFVDLSLNENFMGKPIYNEPFDKNQALSSTPRYNTPEEYKTAARFLNELTGGEGKVKGALDYPAEGLQYLSEFLLAGAASIGRSVARPVNDGDLKELPIINRFVGGPDKNRNIGPYYERANDAQTRSMEYRNKETAEEKRDFLRRNPVAMHPQVQAELKRSRVAIRSINKQRIAVQNNRAMDDAEKRIKLDELNQRIDDVYVRFNTVYNRIEKRERG